MNTNSRLFNSDILRQRGFSLVELMVAMIIGLILTAGVISVYLTSKKSYSVDTGLAQVQENGRFALSFMEPSVRMAGYMGCARVTPDSYLNPPYNSQTAYTFSLPVQGYDAKNTDVGGSYTVPSTIAFDNSATDWTPNLPSDISSALNGYAIKGSDILVLHEAAGLQFGLVSPYQDSAGIFLTAADAGQLAIGQIVILTDCSKSVVFQITNTNSSSGRVDHSNAVGIPGNYTPNFTETFGKDSRLTVAESFVFFIGLSQTDNSPALFEISYNTSGSLSTPTELVPDIENMQVLYGVDTSGDKIPDQFVSASTVDSNGKWGSVVAVRIALISRSDDLSTDANPASAPSFNLNDATITTPIDRRIRKVFVQTIALRNMLP